MAAVGTSALLGITLAANSRIGMAGSTEPEILGFDEGQKGSSGSQLAPLNGVLPALLIL